MSLSFVGFILWTAASVAHSHSPAFSSNENNARAVSVLNAATAAAAVVVAAAVAFQNVPAHYVVYFAAPVVVWHLLIRKVLGMRFVMSF